MAPGLLRFITAIVLGITFVLPGSVVAWRLDVSTTPRAVEKGIGLPATIFCNIKNMVRSTQYLSWVFLDADRVQDQLVSSETVVQEFYRDRFTVSLAAVGGGRLRYSLSISHLTTEDDGTYRCQVMNTFTHTIVQYTAASVSVLYFPDPPSCIPSGKFFVMAHSLVKMSCTSQSGNPTVNMDITRTVNQVSVSPVVPPPVGVGKRPANWTYYENDDTILRQLTLEISPRYTSSSFPCTISAPDPSSLLGTLSSSCVMGPIYVVPVPPTSTIRVGIDPPFLQVAVGQPAKFTCVVTISPPVDMAWVQKTWSTFPNIEPERLVKRDLNYAETVRIRAVEIDDDALVITCQTVIRGITRRASSRLRVVLPTRPPPTKAPKITTTVPTTKPPLRTTGSLKSLVTRKMYTDKDITPLPGTERHYPNVTQAPSPVYPGPNLVPTFPNSLLKPWYSKPTGIALIVVVVLFVIVIVFGVAYVRRFPHRRLTRKESQKCRYQNVWSSNSRQATMRREPSRRQQVTVASTHIYHEARILPEKSLVDSTVDGPSGMPLVVYAETVVNSLYEADDDRSKTIPCHKSAAGKNNRQKYSNVIGSLTDTSKHVTLPNNFMIYGDFNLENTNPYESLIGT